MIEIHVTGPTLEALAVDIDRIDLIDAALTPWMVARLKEKGYSVQIPRQWENIKTFCERLGIHRQTFTRCLGYVGCPEVHLEWSKNRKNIIAIASNDLFDAFCKAGQGTTKKRQASP